MHTPKRFFAPTALLVALVAAAPAQAAVTASEVTVPAKTRFVLYDTSAPHPETLDVAGTAAGSGNVDIVCRRGSEIVPLATDVPVAADGTFAARQIPLDAAADAANLQSPGRSCHLRAFPAGTTPPASGAFAGPVLAVSKYARLELSGAGANDGLLGNYYLYAAGNGYAAEAGALSACDLFTVIQDATTLEPRTSGIECGGSVPRYVLGTKVDGQPAYTTGAIATGVGGAGLQGTPGLPALPEPAVEFDEATGDVAVTETSPLVRCAADDLWPPVPWICTSFDRVPVQVERTTSIVRGGQLIRVVDRWSSTDGRAHTLDFTLDQFSCFGSSRCSEQIEYRFPGEIAYARHDADAATPASGSIAGPLPALEPIFTRDGSGDRVGGAVVIPGQRADGARFFGPDELGIDYNGRSIPATGALTLTHYYATVGGADVEAGTGLLRAWIAETSPAPAPSGGGTHGGGPRPAGTPPALPQLSRRGRVRVRRSGRTFVVTTRDRVRCPAGGGACVVRAGAKAGGAVAGSARTRVRAGDTAKVTFRLRRKASSALKRFGRLPLTVTVSARAGTGPSVAKQRALTIRLP